MLAAVKTCDIADMPCAEIGSRDIVAFALFSTRRLEEIMRIIWADPDEAGARILVRDMKNPGEKIGNDVWCDLPEPALRIVRTMPRNAAEIFPYSVDAIGAAFTRAVASLGIDDLHFHDLRHEGVSRLFELGQSIPRVAAVSGHRSWISLKRYTHLRQVGDEYEGWRWLDVVTSTDAASGTAPASAAPVPFSRRDDRLIHVCRPAPVRRANLLSHTTG